MKIETNKYFTYLTPDEGCNICDINRTQIYDNKIYLGINDNVNNYIEILKNKENYNNLIVLFENTDYFIILNDEDKNVKFIKSKNLIPPTIKNFSICGLPNLIEIQVPLSAINRYINATGWINYKNIIVGYEEE